MTWQTGDGVDILIGIARFERKAASAVVPLDWVGEIRAEVEAMSRAEIDAAFAAIMKRAYPQGELPL